MKRWGLVVAALAVIGSGCFVVATPDGLAVGVNLTPAYTYIPGTSIAVVSNASGDVFRYNNLYYRYWNGAWYRSSIWNGGWVRVTYVPEAFLKIPASHPKFHVVRYHPRFGASPSIVKPAKPAKPGLGLGNIIKKGGGSAKPGKGSSGQGSSGKGSAIKKLLEKKKGGK